MIVIIRSACLVGLAAIAVLALLAGSASDARAAPILDQTSWPSYDPNYYGVPVGTNVFQQGVVAGMSGTLAGFEIFMRPLYGDQWQIPTTFFVNLGSPWQTDTHAFTTTVNATYSWVYVDVSSANIALNAGDAFTIGIGGGGLNSSVGFYRTWNRYTPGALYRNGSAYGGGGYDALFNTYMTPAPEPTTLTLISAGIVGLAWFRKRRASRYGARYGASARTHDYRA